MTRRIGASLVALLAAILLGGCQSMAGAPPRHLPDGYNASVFTLDPSQAVLKQDWTQYTTDEQKQTARNEFVTARMYLIDRAYYDYESNILREAREGGFATDLITMALTTAATAVGSKGWKTALAAGATGVLGAKQAFDKEVLLDRAVQVLQNQMRASRAEVKTRILERLRLAYPQWTIGLAQSDVEEYYQAGTLVGALTAAADSATTRKIEEEAQANRTLSVAYQTDLVTQALRGYLDVDDNAEFARRNDIFKGSLAAAGITDDPSEFTEFNQDKALKTKILDALIAAETNPALRQELTDLRDRARGGGP